MQIDPQHIDPQALPGDTCPRVWEGLSVDAAGLAHLCCITCDSAACAGSLTVGRAGESSLRELLASPATARVREAHLRGDLGALCCGHCAEARPPAAPASPPEDPLALVRVLEVEITDRCNLRCAMCVRTPEAGVPHPRGRDLDPGLFAALAAEFHGLHDRPKELRLQWIGEPLLHPDFAAILAAAADSITVPLVITNGVPLGEGAARAIVSTPGPLRVEVSINAASAASFRAITGVDAYDRVCANVERLLRLRRDAGREQDLAVRLKMLAMPETAGEVEAFLGRWRSHLDDLGVEHATWWDGEGPRVPTVLCVNALTTYGFERVGDLVRMARTGRGPLGGRAAGQLADYLDRSDSLRPARTTLTRAFQPLWAALDRAGEPLPGPLVAQEVTCALRAALDETTPTGDAPVVDALVRLREAVVAAAEPVIWDQAAAAVQRHGPAAPPLLDQALDLLSAPPPGEATRLPGLRRAAVAMALAAHPDRFPDAVMATVLGGPALDAATWRDVGRALRAAAPDRPDDAGLARAMRQVIAAAPADEDRERAALVDAVIPLALTDYDQASRRLWAAALDPAPAAVLAARWPIASRPVPPDYHLVLDELIPHLAPAESQAGRDRQLARMIAILAAAATQAPDSRSYRRGLRIVGRLAGVDPADARGEIRLPLPRLPDGGRVEITVTSPWGHPIYRRSLPVDGAPGTVVSLRTGHLQAGRYAVRARDAAGELAARSFDVPPVTLREVFGLARLDPEVQFRPPTDAPSARARGDVLTVCMPYEVPEGEAEHQFGVAVVVPGGPVVYGPNTTLAGVPTALIRRRGTAVFEGRHALLPGHYRVVGGVFDFTGDRVLRYDDPLCELVVEGERDAGGCLDLGAEIVSAGAR